MLAEILNEIGTPGVTSAMVVLLLVINRLLPNGKRSLIERVVRLETHIPHIDESLGKIEKRLTLIEGKIHETPSA